jgi:hypothetical protein
MKKTQGSRLLVNPQLITFFFLHREKRRVTLAGVTQHPTEE